MTIRTSRVPARASAASGIAIAIALVAMPSAAFAQAAGDNADDNEIVVTGTLIRGEGPVGANQIDLGAKQIEQTASVSANELLASVPQVTNYFNSVPVADLAIAANQIQITRPNIRNISPNNAASSGTLILFDGHRIATAGTSQASIDPDVIPMAAIERVDVVTEGGSATYGADAVAGVINFVTRRRFDGVSVDAKYGFADNYWQTSVNGILGKDWGSGSAYIAYSYSKSDDLFGRDRGFIRRLSYATQPYKPDGRECDLPNLTVNSVFSGITVFSASVAAPNFQAGTVNACDTTDDSAIIPKVKRHGGLLSLSQDLDDTTSVDVRAFYSQRDTLATSPATGSAQLPASFAIPASVPQPSFPLNFLPRVATGSFSFSPLLGNKAERSSTAIKEWGVNTELKKEFGEWQVRGLVNWSRSDSRFRIIQANAARLNAAGIAGTINPFNLAASSPTAVADVMDNMLAAQAVDDLIDLRLITEGKLADLPGGEMRLALGAEYMSDSFKLRSGNDLRIGTLGTRGYDRYKRDVKSVFGELLVPVVDMVEISAAARYDDYEDFGGTFNPKVGVSVKPADWLTLRGNWGTSFTAPTPLDQLRSNANTISAFPFVAFTRPGDTPAGGSFTVALQGSQPNLKPQEADTWSLGFDIKAPFMDGLNLRMNYYNVKFQDILATPTPGVGIFTNFPDNIQTAVGGISAADLRAFGQLAPGGSAVVETLISQGRTVYEIVDFRTGNFGQVKIDGLDFGIDYRTDTGFGGVDLAVNGNYQLNRKSKVGPGAAVIDDLAVDRPKIYLQTALGADIGNLRAQATWNHTGGYDIVPLATTPVQDKVKAFNTVDLFFKYTVPAESGVFKDLSFTLNVDNVLDQAPPKFFGTGPNQNGYANGFSFGRMFVIGVAKKF
ncbi:MAG: hypothetical protein RIQ46_430 [Pseudomonadota bacterium]